jgi:hypothetical protein
MRHIKALSILGVALFAVCMIRVASAEVIWSYNAMAGVPTPPTIQNDLYECRAGKVIFKEGKTGTITLICPVSQNLSEYGDLRSLIMIYRDGDGHEGPSEVTAELRRVRMSDGHVESLQNGIVSSNDPSAPNRGPTRWATHQSAKPGKTINHVMDLVHYYYYVQITLKRNGGAPLAIMGVYLTN